MTRAQRLGVVALGIVIAVVAFLVLQPGDSNESDQAATPTTEPAETVDRPAGETTTEPEPPPKPRPKVDRITLRGGAPQGGVRKINATTGDTVRIVVQADESDELHLHGYDITRNAQPGQPARFRFQAKLEGVFEMESHVAEDAGREAAIAELTVEP